MRLDRGRLDRSGLDRSFGEAAVIADIILSATVQTIIYPPTVEATIYLSGEAPIVPRAFATISLSVSVLPPVLTIAEVNATAILSPSVTSKLIPPTASASILLSSQAYSKLIPPTASASVYLSGYSQVRIISDLDVYKWITAVVTRSVSDPIASLTFDIDGISVPTQGHKMDIFVDDHTGTTQTIFSGRVFDLKYNLKAGRLTSSGVAYENGYYLVNQGLTEQVLSFPIADWDVADIVKYQLNGPGVSWETITGVYPYRIFNPTDNGHDYTPKEFVFSSQTSKQDAINEIANYADMVFLVKPSGALFPDRRLIGICTHVDDVDDVTYGLVLPSMQTFTYPDPYVITATRDSQSSTSINRVIVRGVDTDGVLHEYIKEDPLVTSGDLKPVEMIDESADYADDDLAEERANELYGYYRQPSTTIEVTLIKRVDLVLYQLIKFVGFPGMSEDIARIINIEYYLSHSDPIVKITASYDTDVYKILGRARSQTADTITEIQAVATDTVKKEAPKPTVGTVATVSGNTGTATLENEGGDVTVRFIGE